VDRRESRRGREVCGDVMKNTLDEPFIFCPRCLRTSTVRVQDSKIEVDVGSPGDGTIGYSQVITKMYIDCYCEHCKIVFRLIPTTLKPIVFR
jgi:hypothetical protein